MPNFTVHGPYPVIPKQTKQGIETFVVDPDHAPASQDKFDNYGCYVFVRRWNETLTPWYVGKAAKRTLKEEVFTPHKIDKLDQLKALYKRGGLEIFLIVPGSLRGRPAVRAVDIIETYYIREAHSRNPKILNERKLPKRNWELLGVTDATVGRRTKPAATFRKMMMGVS